MIKTLVDGQVPWALTLAEKLPRLKILRSEAVAKGGGVYELTVWVENTGYLPYPIAMGKRNMRVPPAFHALHEGASSSKLCSAPMLARQVELSDSVEETPK